MNKKVQYDKAELAKLLKNSGFLQFAEACEKLASVWFDGAENDEIGERLQEYILEGGVFGTLHSSLGMQHAKKVGRFKYFMSRIFISNKELRVKYPQLENRPWLVPIYHVRRWFKPVLQKESSKHSKSLVRESSNVSVAEKKNNEWLLRNLGLK